MVKLRLQRFGKRNYATFRLVAADSRSPVKGKFIEILGHLDPHSKKSELNKERVEYWISTGAQPTRTVHNLLVKKRLLKAEKIKVTVKSRKKKKSGDEKPKNEIETDKMSDKVKEESKDEAGSKSEKSPEIDKSPDKKQEIVNEKKEKTVNVKDTKDQDKSVQDESKSDVSEKESKGEKKSAASKSTDNA